MQNINLIEVGPRDGLQNVKDILSVQQKTNLIQSLLDAGFSDIEAGSFVRADKIPAMQGSDTIAQYFANQDDRLWYLAPNQRGLEAALQNQVKQIAFFTATSEAFNSKNIGMSVSESLEGIKSSINLLRQQGYQFINNWNQKPKAAKEIKLRLYVSTVIGCPYEGPQKPDATVAILNELMPLGFAQASLGDTIGVGTPSKWKHVFDSFDKSLMKNDRIAMHCHDTYGTALACISKGLEAGITSFDSSIGGLGGCPYAKGATGNVATEDLVYFLESEGYANLPKVASLLDIFHSDRTGQLENKSRAALALKAK